MEKFKSIRQRGAELICIASISPKALSAEELADAQEIAETTTTGPAPWRRGAACIYAFNIASEAAEDYLRALIRLINDEDEKVHQFIGDMFPHLKDEHIFTLRELLEAFASSPSLAQGWHQFTEFLWIHAVIDPEWTLRVVDLVLKNPHQPSCFRQFAGGEELIRLVLRVYTDPISNAHVRRAAMDIFDRLMEAYSYQAYLVLEELDKRPPGSLSVVLLFSRWKQ